jgi:hypothetical protein
MVEDLSNKSKFFNFMSYFSIWSRFGDWSSATQDAMGLDWCVNYGFVNILN